MGSNHSFTAINVKAFFIHTLFYHVIKIHTLDIGEGIAEVELMQWFVAEGDTINQFDNVCEVQSDKV